MKRSTGRTHWRLLWSANWPVAILLLTGILAGIWLGNDFGVSLDEEANVESGTQALLAYAGADDYFWLPSQADHGPIYFMAFVSTSQLIHSLAPSWTLADGRHLTNYLMFLAGVLSFYLICLRLMSRPYAWMTTILYATQPLLFGHAFINQKDIPFLTLFLATVAAGLAWMDRLSTGSSASRVDPIGQTQAPAPTRRERIKAEWGSLGKGAKSWLIAFCILAGLLMLDVLVVHSIEHIGRELVVSAYNGTAPLPIQRLFDSIATDVSKTPLSLYLARFDGLMGSLRSILPPLLILALLIAGSAALPSLAEMWGYSTSVFRPVMLSSGVLLGALICVRQIGAFAGGLITLAILFRVRWKALFPVMIYWLLAAAVTVATWPYLWPDPIGRLLESVFRVGKFPAHAVLFQGQVFTSTDLPRLYFPTLASLELTEPVVIFVCIGVIAIIWKWRVARQRSFRVEDAIMVLWPAVPLIGLILIGMSAYGNLRQLLFILPPFFILAGKGLETVGHSLRFKFSGVLLTAIVVFPGVMGIIGLHPYEYAYFNAFAGGVDGADGRFDLDPWCTSYREAVGAVNSIAETHARILAIPLSSQVESDLRPDLGLLIGARNVPLADYVMTCASPNPDPPADDFQLLYQVERQGAVFARVWKRLGKP